jgi:hypothetical protein
MKRKESVNWIDIPIVGLTSMSPFFLRESTKTKNLRMIRSETV